MRRIIVLVTFLMLLLSGCGGTTMPQDVVQAFRDEGLPVADSYPIAEEPGSEQSPLPETYIEAERFEIPSLEGGGGRVFRFENEEDLEIVYDYYEGFSEMELGISLDSHLYRKDLILVQINGQLPEDEAQRYEAVLESL